MTFALKNCALFNPDGGHSDEAWEQIISRENRNQPPTLRCAVSSQTTGSPFPALFISLLVFKSKECMSSTSCNILNLPAGATHELNGTMHMYTQQCMTQYCSKLEDNLVLHL